VLHNVWNILEKSAKRVKKKTGVNRSVRNCVFVGRVVYEPSRPRRVTTTTKMDEREKTRSWTGRGKGFCEAIRHDEILNVRNCRDGQTADNVRARALYARPASRHGLRL